MNRSSTKSLNRLITCIHWSLDSSIIIKPPWPITDISNSIRSQCTIHSTSVVSRLRRTHTVTHCHTYTDAYSHTCAQSQAHKRTSPPAHKPTSPQAHKHKSTKAQKHKRDTIVVWCKWCTPSNSQWHEWAKHDWIISMMPLSSAFGSIPIPTSHKNRRL
jgi:hypothetical protein